MYEPILDISRYQDPVNWDIMWNRGVRIVTLRLSVGNYYKDTRFEEYWSGACARGMIVGVYHVTKPSLSASSQWVWVLACLNGKVPDFFVLDNELSDGKSPAEISAVIETLTNLAKNYFGQYPVQYLRGEWWNTNTVSKAVFALCPLWIARYTGLPHPWNDAPSLRPRDWQDYTLWQYSADGNGEGAYFGVGSDDVDKNKSRYANLEATLVALSITPPPPAGENEMTKPCQCVCFGSWINLRAQPNANAVDAGNFNKNEFAQYFPAFTKVIKPDLPNKEIWLLILKNDGTVGWAAQWHASIKNPSGQQYEAIKLL